MSVIGLLQKVIGLQKGRGEAAQIARTLTPELLTQITGTHQAPGDPTNAGDPTAPICIGIRATVRAALPDSPHVPVLLRQISSLGAEMLVEGPLPNGEQFWLYIPTHDNKQNVAIWCVVLACETGGFEESAYVATATFIEGDPPQLEIAPAAEEAAAEAKPVAPQPRPDSPIFSKAQPSVDEDPEEAAFELIDEPGEPVSEEGNAPMAAKVPAPAPAPEWKEIPLESASKPAAPTPAAEEPIAVEAPAVPATPAPSAAPVVEAPEPPASIPLIPPHAITAMAAAIKKADEDLGGLDLAQLRRVGRTINAQVAFLNRIKRRWDQKQLTANDSLRQDLQAVHEAFENLRLRLAADEERHAVEAAQAAAEAARAAARIAAKAAAKASAEAKRQTRRRAGKQAEPKAHRPQQKPAKPPRDIAA
jgi:hypothetical protein